MKTLKDLTDRIAAEHGLEWYQPLNKAEDSAGMTAIDLGNGYSLHHEHSENGHDIWAVGFNGERAGTFMLKTEDTRRGKPMVAWAGLEKPHRGKGIGTLAYKALAVHYGGIDSDKASSSDEAVKAWIRAGGRQMKIKSQFGKPRYTLDGDKKRPVVQWNEELVKAPMMNEGNAWQEPVQTALRDSDIEKIKEGVSGNHTIKTFNLPNDLYHHVITHNNIRFVEHIISDDEDPFANGITRVAGDINQNGHLIIGSSQTEPYHQNKGYGKLAYTQALKYHGGLVSDVDLSHTANSIWKHLKTLPNVDVKFGKKGTPQRHLATLKKSSNLNTIIQQAKARLEGVKKVGSQEPRPMIFANKDGTKHGFVTVDPSKQGQWRVTHFVNNKPAGHTEAPTFSHAIKAAHDSGYNVFKAIREEEMFKAAPQAKFTKLLPANQRPEQDVKRIEPGISEDWEISGGHAKMTSPEKSTPSEKVSAKQLSYAYSKTGGKEIVRQIRKDPSVAIHDPYATGVSVASTKAPDEVVAHEAHHRTVTKLVVKYGLDKVHKLYDNMIRLIPNDVQRMLTSTLKNVPNYNAMHGSPDPRQRLAFKEEMVNLLRDFTTGKEGGRRRFLKDYTSAHYGSPEQFNKLDNVLKNTWQKVQDFANSATEDHMR